MENYIKLITYNIDGLPEQLDLNDLPWLFKPIAWIYKLFKGTTVITINDNHDVEKKILAISNYLSTTDVDVIGIQEDFNYHDTLMQHLKNYNDSTFSGKIDFSDAFHFIKWFPYPRFKADGLNLITKNDKVSYKNEEIVKWNKSYGYFTHANDKLTTKGFRFYSLNVNGINLNIYIVHMDADFYNPDTCPDVGGDIEARKSQLQQLSEFIIEKNSSNPSIIMGDTNSTEKYEWDRENINEYLLKPINATSTMNIKEAVPSNRTDVDRLFYINTTSSTHDIEIKNCFFDVDICYSDHKPLIIELILNNKNGN
jgi:exonuclease III